MKRLASVLIMLFVFVFGCGGGGGDSGGAPGNPTPTPTPTPIPTLSNISLMPVPASDLTETINFLVNKDFADAHPELTVNVGKIVADVNAVLAKNMQNQKRYALGKVMTYDVGAADLGTIKTNPTPTYFTDNNFVGKRWDGSPTGWGGTTVVYWAQSSSNLPQVFQDAGASAFATSTSVGKTYGMVFIAESATTTALLGKAISGGSYDIGIAILSHELGHTLGLGIPEWYSLECSDNSGTLPNLSYSLPKLFPADPMGMGTGAQNPTFASFNSWLISHNANHQLNMGLILFASQNFIEPWVKVVDASGSPVPNVAVTVYGGVAIGDITKCYGAVGVAKNMATLVGTYTTDVNGMAHLDRDVWFAKGVKASRGEKYAGAVMTLIDLEDAYFRQGLDKFTLTLTLN